MTYVKLLRTFACLFLNNNISKTENPNMKDNLLQQLISTISILIILLCNSGATAQDSVKAGKNIFYVTVGGGIGSGYPLQEKNGISCMLELGIQKDMAIFALGVRGVGELSFLSNINNSMRSLEITYGRVYKSRRLFSSISAGLGLATELAKGKIQSSSLFFNRYEKISYRTIGFPISAKAFWLPSTHIGLGAEVFANLNRLNTFYGVNFSILF